MTTEQILILSFFVLLFNTIGFFCARSLAIDVVYYAAVHPSILKSSFTRTRVWLRHRWVRALTLFPPFAVLWVALNMFENLYIYLDLLLM